MQVPFYMSVYHLVNRGALDATCIIFCNKPVLRFIRCVFIKKRFIHCGQIHKSKPDL